jgi:hypothetical protein
VGWRAGRPTIKVANQVAVTIASRRGALLFTLAGIKVATRALRAYLAGLASAPEQK